MDFIQRVMNQAVSNPADTKDLWGDVQDKLL